MIFDYKAYSRLLNEFIIEGEKIEKYRDPAFNKICLLYTFRAHET